MKRLAMEHIKNTKEKKTEKVAQENKQTEKDGKNSNICQTKR